VSCHRVIHTTPEEKIYIRWYCVDLLSPPPRQSGTGEARQMDSAGVQHFCHFCQWSVLSLATTISEGISPG
jgi:hypothetical protein